MIHSWRPLSMRRGYLLTCCRHTTDCSPNTIAFQGQNVSVLISTSYMSPENTRKPLCWSTIRAVISFYSEFHDVHTSVLSFPYGLFFEFGSFICYRVLYVGLFIYFYKVRVILSLLPICIFSSFLCYLDLLQ